MIIPATRDSDVEEVKRILKRRNGPDGIDVWKFTALMYTASESEKDLTRLPGYVVGGLRAHTLEAMVRAMFEQALGYFGIMEMLLHAAGEIVGIGRDVLARLKKIFVEENWQRLDRGCSF